MEGKIGREGKYDRLVKPNLEKIKQVKRNGGTDIQIAEQLGVAVNTFYRWKREYPEFKDALEGGVREFVTELRGQLAKVAFKHTLKTTKTYVKRDTESGHETAYTETVEKEVDPNIGAVHLLLKNLDKQNWSNDPIIVDIKKEELELRKKIAEAKEGDF